MPLTPSLKKSLAFFLSSLILLVASLWLIAVPFHGQKDIYYWLIVLGVMVFTLNSLSLSSLFPFSRHSALVLALLAAVFIQVVFPSHPLQILASLVVMGGVLQMSQSIGKIQKENLHFSYYHVVKKGMMYFLISVLLLVAINVYANTAQSMQRNPERFYDSVAEAVVKSMQPGEDTKLEDKRLNLFSVIGVETSGKTQITEVLKRLVRTRVQEIFEPIRVFIPALYALLLFLSLRFLLPILIWLSGGIGTLFFRLLKRMGWVKMAIRTVHVESPELD